MSSWQKLGVHGVHADREQGVHDVHGECSRSLGGMFTVFTDSVSAGGESVHTGRGVYKTPYRERALDSLFTATASILACFPGSEVIGAEPTPSALELEAQAERVKRWNDWQLVLEEDRRAKHGEHK